MPKRIRSLNQFLQFILLLCFSLPIYANSGVDWLINQADGQYSTPDDLATPFVATMETWLTLSQLGETAQPSMSPALDFISAESFLSTEHLARILMIRLLAGQAGDELIEQLVTRLHGNGGFGDLEGYDRTVLDTAFVLDALAATDLIDTSITEFYPSIDYLLKSFNGHGWSDNDNDTSLYVTALAMHALWQYRHHVSHIPSLNVEFTLDSAQSYLQTQLNQGNHETFEIALALIALIPRLTHLDGISSHIDALRTAQLPNGSWDNDVYTTALALRALHVAEMPNPDLGRIIGTIVDGQMGLPLLGLPVGLKDSDIVSQTTDVDGKFVLNQLLAGDYILQIGSELGGRLTVETGLETGQTKNLGTIRFVFNDNVASIQGTVTNQETGEILTNANITVTGIEEIVHTDEQGTFLVRNLEPKEVTIQASKAGYATVRQVVTLKAGRTFIFSPALVPSFVTVQGIVTDGQTDSPLADVTILANGVETKTNPDGSYTFSELPGGLVEISTDYEGYKSVLATFDAPMNASIDFSPKLYPSDVPQISEDSAIIIGTVIDKATQQPLASVMVTVGDNSTYTNAQGQFMLGDLAEGETQATFQLEGYAEQQVDLDLVAFGRLNVGEVVLSPEGYYVPASIRGQILDAETGLPIVLYFDKWTKEPKEEQLYIEFIKELTVGYRFLGRAYSNLDGYFEITGLTKYYEGDLQINHINAKNSYQKTTLHVVLSEGETLDLGQIRLLPKSTNSASLPDLLVQSIDYKQVIVEPHTLDVSGTLKVLLRNVDRYPAPEGVGLLAFYDTDLDNTYTQGTDIVLGQAQTTESLEGEADVAININLQGQLPFRDAPINVWVNSNQVATETIEHNNTRSSANWCGISTEPVNFEMKKKWEVMGNYRSTYPPIIVPIQDTNYDGVINQQDHSAIILNVYLENSNIQAFDGKDGSIIWKLEDYPIPSSGGLAFGDIDADGLPEILQSTVRYDRDTNSHVSGILMLNHKGKVEWKFEGIKSNALLTLADLDSDGSTEILANNLVFNSNGTIKWENVTPKYWYNGLVIDMEGDGLLEVISSNNVFSHDGSVLQTGFPLSSNSKYHAVVNLDDDPFPEIVTAKYGLKVYEHDGSLKWNAFAGSDPGSVVIADIDGDGLPEIGVSSKYAYYVYEHDGSLKWFNEHYDDTGGHDTGSVAFDFDNDGRAEVVHYDSGEIYISDGTTGRILSSIQSPSGTGFDESPIVADVDGDGHAELVLATPDTYFSGLTVYESVDNSWAPARGIWNQYHYSINNVNDDGTIPPWTLPTSYRAQQNRYYSDLTIGYLRVIDNGLGHPLSLKVRIGNAGAAPSPENLTLTFYAGDPATQGTVLGTITLDAFAPGTYQDIQLDNVNLTALDQDIYAVVDSGNGLAECNEDNNSIALGSLETETTLNQLTLTATTNATTYGPNTPVAIDYAVLNQGALSTNFQIEVRLEDADGNIVTLLQPATANTLTSGDTLSQTLEWNTGTTLAGNYQIHALLLSPEGELVTETRHAFEINAGNDTVLGLRATTDKARYSTTDVVQMNALLQNSSTNVLVEDALLNVTIKGPEQQVLHTESQALNSLPPNGMQQIILPYMLQNATLGTYTLDIEILAHDNTVLANQTHTFQVTEEQDAILLGQMDVSLAQLTRGQIQHCTQTLTNTGTQNINDLSIQHLLIDLNTQTTLMSQDDNLTLAVGENHSQTITHYTQQLPVGYYACVLQAHIDGQWQVLDFKTFNLHSVLSSECSTVYAVHDQKREDSQIFTYDLNQDLIQPLGPLYLGYDLEGLDVHPYTHQIFASAGKENAHLYQVDGYTGDLTPLGITGFDDIVALSFDATGTLWGWSKQGLIRLSLDTGKGQLILPDQHTLEVEGLAWNNAGTLLYGAAMSASDQNSALWVYNPQQNTLEQRCANLPGEVESLEILPDDRLAFGIHDDKQLSFHIYDADACQTINHAKMRIPFNDVEAIAWPTVNCNAQQQALRAFLTVLSDDIFVGEDRNLRVSLDGQTHVGQLAEETTQGIPTVDGQVQLVAIPDANGDGLDDFIITYPDGMQQVLYYQGITQD